MKLLIKEEGDMSKNKGRRDISPGKKPGPLTKKERKERKKKRHADTVLRWFGDLIFKNIVCVFFFHLDFSYCMVYSFDFFERSINKIGS
jgi:hypothetical protein